MHVRTVGAVLVTLAMLPRAARADSNVTVTLTPDGEAFAAANGDTPAEYEVKLGKRLASAYQTARVEEYLQAFANATAFSNRGIGVDYASNSKSLTLGIAGNVAVSAADLQFNADENQYPVGGVAPNLTLMAGLNFSRWGLPKLTVFGNGFYRKASLSQLDGSITNAGLHAQYKLFGTTQGKKSPVATWGGVDLTAGVEYTKWTLQAGKTLDSTFDVDGSAIDAASTGRFDLTSSSFGIPIEATTSLRFLYVLSVFGGVGVDLQQGSTKANANLDIDLSNTANGTITDIGTATLTANGDSSPSAGRVRFLAGLQVNIWKLKVFVQTNLVPVDTASVAFGLRAVL